MLIARAPLRVTLAGEGTDLQAYYAKYGGAVVSTTIDKFVYVFISKRIGDRIRISSADHSAWCRGGCLKAPPPDDYFRLSSAILDRFGIGDGVSVFVSSEVPSDIGLGSASAHAVALVKAASLICKNPLTRPQVAELACSIEIDRLQMPIGKQDAYATAFGGLNYMEFDTGSVTVEPLHLPGDALLRLSQNLMLFFTGRRDAIGVLEKQRQNVDRNRASAITALHGLRDSASALRVDLLKGNVAAVGDWLDTAWDYQRRLAPGVSDPWIDDWYRRARSAGARGGKLTGAGGGGVLLLYCEPEDQERLTKTLDAVGLMRLEFRFEPNGAMVVVNGLPRVQGANASGLGRGRRRQITH